MSFSQFYELRFHLIWGTYVDILKYWKIWSAKFDIITPLLYFLGSKGFFYNVFCSGGINKEDPFNPKDNKENGMMAFFRDVIGNWLNKPYAKAIVLTCFLGYLCVASWGVTQLKEGLEKKRLSRFDSYSVDFYDVEDQYFREYPFRINVSKRIASSQYRKN